MKKRVKLYLLLAIILFAINGSKANPGRKCNGVTCGIKYEGKEKVHIGVVYTGHTFNMMFNTSGRLQNAEMGKTLQFNSQRSYGAIVRLLGRRQAGLRASFGINQIEYLISGASSDLNFSHQAERSDIDLGIGIEKHIAFSKVVRAYIGPNVPIIIKGNPNVKAGDATETPVSSLSVGGGLTAGLMLKLGRYLTLGVDCEGLYKPYNFNISYSDVPEEKLRFGNLAVKGNVYLGIAF